MGWFLGSSDRKKTGASQRRARALSRQHWDPQKTWATMQILGSIGLILAVAISWQRLESILTSYASQFQKVPVAAERVILVQKPAWMNKTLEEKIKQETLAKLTGDPTDAQALNHALTALQENPWVEQVQNVKQSPEGQVRVQAIYRQPMALIETPAGYCLVDQKGAQLPGTYQRNVISRMNMPVITGVSAKAPGYGKSWAGEDVQAGLSLVKLLLEEPYLNQVQAFDVSERDSQNRIRLVLKTRTGMVRWGLPPGHEQPIESEAAVKKQWLANICKTYRGQVDAGGKIVDVYGAGVFVHAGAESELDQQAGYTWSR